MYSTYEMVEGKIVLTLNLQHTSGTAYSGFGFYYVNSTGGNTYRAKYRTEIKLIPK
jgi:hypothetical protein